MAKTTKGVPCGHNSEQRLMKIRAKKGNRSKKTFGNGEERHFGFSIANILEPLMK